MNESAFVLLSKNTSASQISTTTPTEITIRSAHFAISDVTEWFNTDVKRQRDQNGYKNCGLSPWNIISIMCANVMNRADFARTGFAMMFDLLIYGLPAWQYSAVLAEFCLAF
mmetsp:Transcript_7362/g.10778  ORF Transcript_7362/g.10778 Transcript_7362/m.10778 type:complete len:112 (-) Transcript_7362:30-365(-)